MYILFLEVKEKVMSPVDRWSEKQI